MPKIYPFIKIAVKAVSIIAAALVILAVLNYLVFPLFGFKYNLTSAGLKYSEVVSYSGDESRILNILIIDTVVLNEIPQFDYLAEKSGFQNEKLTECLRSLEKKGDIAFDDRGRIVDAYPWTSRETDISVYTSLDGRPELESLNAAGALFAMSALPLLEKGGKIEAVLRDTGEILIIEVENNEIVYTNKIAAVVYRTDNYKSSGFFASPDGAQKYLEKKYDKDRVLRLDKALSIGDIIARKLKEKIEN